tara:strand:+ start:43865 stop:44209 length:345 start_codon:yes stop_codon:yes gene_type:complete
MKIPVTIVAPRFTKLMSVFIDVTAITLFPFIVSKEEMSKVTLNHETIHIHQQKELFVLFFYMLYIFDWFKGLIKYQNARKAYFQIRFEQEAYAKMYEEEYLLTRKKYSWRDYKV